MLLLRIIPHETHKSEHFEAAFIESLQTAKTHQSALIVEKMSSLQRDPSPYHIPTEPAAWPSKHLLQRWQFRCEMVRNRTQSCDLEPGEREIAVENLKPSKHTTGKAFQTCNFLLANRNDENDLDSNPNAIQEGWCWSTTTPRPDSKVRFPRGSG